MPGFSQARRDPKSPYRDWYVWSKKKPRNANKGMVFPGVQKSTWSYDPRRKAWYFHRFYDFQPDLNTSNPHVQAEILKIMGFWIQLGVSGFRMDAVPFVIATKAAKVTQANRAVRHAAGHCASFCNGGRATPSFSPRQMFCRHRHGIFRAVGDRMHMMFNFQVNQNLFYALRRRRAAAAKGAQGHQAAPRDGAMGHVPAESRRARSRTPHEAATGDRYSRRSDRNPRCSFMSAASGAGSLRCSTATAGASNSPTA